MELLIIVSSATLNEDILTLFDQLDITGFTRIPQVTGSGQGGGIRLNDEVWPGENVLFLFSATAEQSAEIKEWARKYRDMVVREGLKVFSLALQEMI